MSDNVSVSLRAGQSVDEMVIRHLLAGIDVKIVYNGNIYFGQIHNFDFTPGAGYAFAKVHIAELNYEEWAEGHAVFKVSIHTDGEVNLMPGPYGESKAA